MRSAGRTISSSATSPPGRSRAGLDSLVATCESRSINPFDYLADALARIQDHPATAIDVPLPGAWAAAD